MIDERGHHKVKQYFKVREAIKKWMEENPNGKRSECLSDLGICASTLRKHQKELGLEIKKR